MIAKLSYNLRYALRSLARTPGFTAAVLLTLAIGIGATTAVVSAIDAILLRPLPFPDADRLVRLNGDPHAEGFMKREAFTSRGYLPARRVTRIEPMRALRED
jgi:putative ABC transport system permease protein